MPCPLSAFSVADTHQVDEARAILFHIHGARYFDAQGDQERFHAKGALVNLGSSSLSHCRFGSPVRIDFPNDDLVKIQVCTAGNGRTSVGTRVAEVSPSSIVCSTTNATFELGQSFEQFILRISRTRLDEDIIALLGTRPKDRIAFDMMTESDNGRAQRFRQKILFSARSVDLTHEPIPAPLLREMDQSIRISALYSLPHNLSDSLYSGIRKAAPWQVTRIEDWIDANWATSVTIEKLAEVSASSIRSIFATFKSARGYTPMNYLQRVRLQAARRMLLSARPDDTVTSVGLACRFANLGHFAQAYQRQFGELPSETLRTARFIEP